MNSVRARVAYVVTLAVVALTTLAVPAGAASLSDSAVLASDKFKWFYWLGFILAASLILWILATIVGYYIRVIRPKHRGRETS